MFFNSAIIAVQNKSPYKVSIPYKFPTNICLLQTKQLHLLQQQNNCCSIVSSGQGEIPDRRL